MNSTSSSEQTIDNIVQAVLTNGNGSAKQPDSDYRYYHCNLDWNGLKCKKVDGLSITPTQDCTKLLFVKSYIPERFDKYILKYKWMPDSVFIETSQLKK